MDSSVGRCVHVRFVRYVCRLAMRIPMQSLRPQFAHRVVKNVENIGRLMDTATDESGEERGSRTRLINRRCCDSFNCDEVFLQGTLFCVRDRQLNVCGSCLRLGANHE